MTIIAVGTSLPELATAIVATLRRHLDVVLANVIDSNIFNILFILNITAAITPIPVAIRFGMVDAPVQGRSRQADFCCARKPAEAGENRLRRRPAPGCR